MLEILVLTLESFSAFLAGVAFLGVAAGVLGGSVDAGLQVLVQRGRTHRSEHLLREHLLVLFFLVLKKVKLQKLFLYLAKWESELVPIFASASASV